MIKILPKTLRLQFLLLFFIFNYSAQSQTKKIKRPSSRVGIGSVDTFVRNSFDLYDKVYMYDGYAESGTPLEDNDLDVLADALDDLSDLSSSAPDIISDLDGQGALKQAKATLQINRAKKALTYSIKTAKKLLTENKKTDEEEPDSTSNDDVSEVDQPNPNTSDSKNESIVEENVSDNLEIYSKFDYVPGDELIFFDDFSQDFIGDFPSKWNTNGTGEVVTLNKVEGNWFEFIPGYGIHYLPLIEEKFPEEYTIEFDLLAEGLDKNTSSTARLYITLDDNNGFNKGRKYAYITLPFGQYSAFGIQIKNTDSSDKRINATVTADIRNAVVNKPHISIAVNKKRFRLWVNEKKYIDVPQLIFAPDEIGYIKFNVHGIKDGEEHIFINNLKIAKGGLDLRRTLISEGRVSTNGILFDSGSANIKPQSYGIIRQISQVLLQDKSMNLNIVGHTDADGNDDSNLKLSKARAEAVKQALIDIYSISGDRLQTDGKGESEPIGDNNSVDGKAQNRRVEFIKI